MFDNCSVRSVFISSKRFWCSVVHSKLFCCLRMLENSVKYNCILYTYLLKKFNIPRSSCIFFLFESGWCFWIASMRDFNGVMCLFLYFVKGILLVLEKSVTYLGLLSCFLVVIIDDIFIRQ